MSFSFYENSYFQSIQIPSFCIFFAKNNDFNTKTNSYLFYTKVNQTTLTLNSLSEKPIFYYFDYIEAFFKNQ